MQQLPRMRLADRALRIPAEHSRQFLDSLVALDDDHVGRRYPTTRPFADDDVVMRPRMHRADVTAVEALDPERRHFAFGIGLPPKPVAPRSRDALQSVEYLGWTFSPWICAIALFAAIAASPMPIVINVILPG